MASESRDPVVCAACHDGVPRELVWGTEHSYVHHYGDTPGTVVPCTAAQGRVYVDDVRVPWRGKHWSHLTADTEEALHEFAARIGLKREWFQPSSTRPEAHHYDVTDAKRDEAILAGAIPETWREGAARRRAAGEARRAAA